MTLLHTSDNILVMINCEYTAATDTTERLSLVLGVDGSGKTTLLDGLSVQFGVVVLEPTSTPEAKAFKVSHLDTQVDGLFIDQRESIFLGLNSKFDLSVQQELTQGRNVATTGNGLVTLVSHGLMRTIVGAKGPHEVVDCTGRWMDSNALKPENLLLVHAPDEVIRQRIQGRQQAGDHTERFWGFNSPYFLSRYQEVLREVISVVAENTMIRCIELDSSQLTPQAMIDSYARLTTNSQTT